jgi:hypothetical protein
MSKACYETLQQVYFPEIFVKETGSLPMAMEAISCFRKPERFI